MAAGSNKAQAVVLERPGSVVLRSVDLIEPTETDVVVAVEFSGISTGTEKLLWSGEMPPFPGLGYPLVPGYEAAGIIEHAGAKSGFRKGEYVFAPGSSGFKTARGLFGANASRLVVRSDRIARIDGSLGADATLVALAATAHRAVTRPGKGGGFEPNLPQLIVGHGVLGRLIARIVVAMGGVPPVVWETSPGRRDGSWSYGVIAPEADDRRGYDAICDVSGDSNILDCLISRLAPGGEIVLAGFYSKPLSFAFPAAFMREARLRASAEFRPDNVAAVLALIESGALSLKGLISHQAPASDAETAYATAFTDKSCLKLVLDWRH